MSKFIVVYTLPLVSRCLTAAKINNIKRLFIALDLPNAHKYVGMCYNEDRIFAIGTRLNPYLTDARHLANERTSFRVVDLRSTDVSSSGGDVGRKVPIHQNTSCHLLSVGGAETKAHITIIIRWKQ
jgi:hypothetical protein